MKYLKRFEISRFEKNVKGETLKNGDYVLLKLYASEHSPYHVKCAVDYINNHVGKVSDINKYNFDVKVEFENIPEDIQSYFGKTKDKNIFYRTTEFEKIVSFGDTPDEMEMYINSKNYNL